MTVKIEEYRAGLLVEYWEDFRANVIPDNAPPFQLQAMYQAFIGGMCAYDTTLTAAIAFAQQKNENPMDAWDKVVDELNTLVQALQNDPIASASGAVATLLANGKVIAENIPVEAGEGVPRVSVFQTHGLDNEDIDGLNELIAGYIADRKQQKAASQTH